MWLVAYYDEYEGFDLGGTVITGEKLFKTKRDAKLYARHMNKKMHIPYDSANGYTCIFIGIGKEEE